MGEQLAQIEFTYKNHRGEVAVRRVIPIAIRYLSAPGYGYQPGWFLIGNDLDKGESRNFRLSNIDGSADLRLWVRPDDTP